MSDSTFAVALLVMGIPLAVFAVALVLKTIGGKPMVSYTKVKGRFETNVAGVTFVNDDGSSRQEAIAHCEAGERAYLKHRPVRQDRNAVEVRNSQGEQMGWLGRSVAADIVPYLKSGETVEAHVLAVQEFTSDSGERMYGCRLLITKPEARDALNNGDIEPDAANSGGLQSVGTALFAIGAVILLAALLWQCSIN